MRNLISALILILAMALAASAQKPKSKPKADPKPKTAAGCPGANGLTAPEIVTILEEHNRMRASLGLGKVSWSCNLADTAQAWASKGAAQHRQDVEFGENMFVATNPQIAITTAMANWEKEKAFWNNTAGTCQPGKTCTHYTQMVWRATTQVGCGINRSNSGQWKTFMVCNYNPGGNTGGSAY
jgi:pathogenesis-related protein 1